MDFFIIKEMSRLFIALPVPKSLENKILRFQIKHASLDIRWISGKNLHLTIVPPWETTDIEKYISYLETQKQKWNAQKIIFKKIELAPPTGIPKLIWAKASAPDLLLTDIRNKIVQELNLPSADFQKILPHITIARFRTEEIKKIPKKIFPGEIHWEESFTELALYKSILAPKEAQYEILKKIPL